MVSNICHIPTLWYWLHLVLSYVIHMCTLTEILKFCVNLPHPVVGVALVFGSRR